MRAVILAGGKGTRLRPLTHIIPKPLFLINQKPILEHIIEYLKEHGITDIIISLGYMGSKIKNYFKDGSSLGVKIDYIEENEPMGTAGCLTLLKNKPKSTFLLIAGDNLTTLDLKKFIEFHKKKKAKASVALVQIDIPIQFGIANVDDEGNINKFIEKPILKHYAGTMIYLLEPEVLEIIKPGDDFAGDIIPKLINKKLKVCGYKLLDEEFWADIGNIEEYHRLNEEFKGG